MGEFSGNTEDSPIFYYLQTKGGVLVILTPVTELDAVNEIIGAIGESPVNTIENPTNVDVINALRILTLTNRQVQAKGWSFNIHESYKLNPDLFSKRIRWLDSILFIVGTDGTRYVKRGEYVYDFTNQTDIFEKPIEVECILLVPFEDMPEPMRQYITAKAAREFQVRYLGDASLTEELARYEMEAWQALQEYEMDLNDFNMLDMTGVQQLRRR